jgi:peptidyl-prolyl cis-trans isomerase SurA
VPAAVVAALAAAVFCGPAPGRAETVESVVAVVEDQPILRSEVQGRMLLEMEQRGIDPSDSATVRQLRDLVVGSLIDERVLELHAKEAGLTVSEDQVVQAVEEAIGRNREAMGSEQLFRLQLEREGLTEAELRQRFTLEARRRMLADRVVQAELGGPVEVAPDEVRRYFEEHRAELPQREAALHLQRIVVLIEPDSVQVERAHAAAVAVLARIRGGELSFADAARRYSDDPNTNNAGGDLHRLERGDLAGSLGSDFEDQVFALEPGTVSEPLASPFGFHLFLVQERSPEQEWIRASHVLFSVPRVHADQVRAEQEAEQLRAEAAAGADFEELARRHSDAPEGPGGGDVGWVPLELLEEPLRDALAPLAPGAVSPVIPVQGAFIIARYLEREEARPYEFPEIEGELTEHVRAVRMEERFREWVDRLRERYYIERRAWD